MIQKGLGLNVVSNFIKRPFSEYIHLRFPRDNSIYKFSGKDKEEGPEFRPRKYTF